jgi:hypothetical protein
MPGSFAQDQNEFCSPEVQAENQQCGGGIGCRGTLPAIQYERISHSGLEWLQAKQQCSGGFGCYVVTYESGFDCFVTELRSKETQDQLAALASDRSVLVADCKGHYREYRGRAPARSDSRTQ